MGNSDRRGAPARRAVVQARRRLLRWGSWFAIVPSGNEVRDQSYRLVQHPRLSRDKLREAMQEMSRFFN